MNKRKTIILISIIVAIGFSIISVSWFTTLKNNQSKKSKVESNFDDISKYVDDITLGIIKKSNNEADKGTLITKKYPIGNLTGPENEHITIRDLNEKFEVECLRNNLGCYYSIHKTLDGSYVYISYNLDKEKKSLVVSSIESLHNVLDKQDFNSVKVGKTTYNEVKKIDPKIVSFESNYGIKSFVTLQDGGHISITCKLYEPNTVTEIKYTPPAPNSVINFILKKDFPENHSQTWTNKKYYKYFLTLFFILCIGVFSIRLIKLRNRAS